MKRNYKCSGQRLGPEDYGTTAAACAASFKEGQERGGRMAEGFTHIIFVVGHDCDQAGENATVEILGDVLCGRSGAAVL